MFQTYELNFPWTTANVISQLMVGYNFYQLSSYMHSLKHAHTPAQAHIIAH